MYRICKSEDLPAVHMIRFTSCANTGSVTMRTDRMKGYTKAIGGITSIGTLCRIDKCFNSGKITLPQTSHNNTSAGGIMAGLSNPHDGGNGDKGHLFDTYNTGKVTGGHFAGGLVGYTDIGIRLNRCYAIGKVSNAKYRGTLYPKSVTRVKYAKSCYKNGKSVSGKAWKNSASLKRKVLKSIPETNIPSSKK